MALRAADRVPNRIPPHNLDAEESVLGAMLESRDAISAVVEILRPEDFYKPAHARIYEVICDIYARSQPADAITVAEELGRRGLLDQIGGKPYIHGLLEAYPTASSAAHYARIVDEHATLRRLVEAGNKVQELGFSIPEDVGEAVDEAEQTIYEVGDRRLRSELQQIKPLLSQTMENLEILMNGQGTTGLASGFGDLDDKTLGFQPTQLVIVAARPSMGKCLAGDSLIDDPATGERVTIRDYVARKVEGVSGLDHKALLRTTEIADWVPNGRKECFRLTTRSGRRIDLTDNHPLMTAEGWVPLADMSPGDRIAAPHRLPVFGDGDGWSDVSARLLAYLVAEGCLLGKSPTFTNMDVEIINDFMDCVEASFPDCAVVQADRISWRIRSVRLTRPRVQNSVTRWLADLGLMGKRSEDRFFPSAVWRFTRKQLREFLRALFSCDGTIYPMSAYARIEYTVASQRLAEDVQHALLRFGIVSKLWQKTERSWRVEITQPESVDRYQLEIGWIGEKARRGFLTSDHRRSNNGHLPASVWALVRKACANSGISLSELARRSGEAQNLHTKRALPRARLEKYASILDDDDLRFLSSPDLYWDEITSIQPVGERDVYDIEVPDGNNFVAQDICVHNSSLLGDFALNAAVRLHQPVIMFSLEMSASELTQRFLASEARVDSQKMRRGTLAEQDWTKMSAALGRLSEAPLYIDDSANITLMEMRAKCRRLKARQGLRLVIIDYLQLMQSPRRSENRQQEVSEISRGLKILAKELEVPVMCASQLNRAVEARHDKRPFLGDLRESGSIEQDADLVMFIYRDEVYNPDSEARGEAEIIIAKHRNGPTGTVRLAFMNQYTKFASIAKGI